MRRLFGCLALVALLGAASLTSAQETPSLVLTIAEGSQTFSVSTGSMIEVQLPIPNLNVQYDPTRLEFLSYGGPPASGGASGPGMPGLSGGGSPGSSAPGSAPGVSVPSVSVSPGEVPPVGIVQPSVGNTEPGQSGETGAVTISSGEVTAQVATAEAGVVVTAEPGVIGGGPEMGVWQFRAVGPGQTNLEFHIVAPPCQPGRPCPMMPALSITYYLNISGQPVAVQPIEGTGETVGAGAENGTLNVEVGQIVSLELDGPPISVSYNASQVEYLPGDGARFRVTAAGAHTFVQAVSASGGFGLYLDTPAACDSCGVISLVPVESVTAQVMESNPPQLSLTINWHGGSSCSEPVQFREGVSGSQISIQVYYDANTICTMDYGPQSATYTVQTPLPGGTYTVDVNGVSISVSL